MSRTFPKALKHSLVSAFPRLCGGLAIAIGLAALAGWAFALPALKSLLPQEAPIEANTALALIFCGLALWRIGYETSAGRSATQVVALIVLILGLATLAEHVFAIDLGVDELFFRDTSDVPNAVPGRMSPYSAIAFVALGLALTAFNVTWLRPLVWSAAALAAFIGGVPIAGYFLNANAVISNPWLSPLAATFAFVGLGVGTIVASARDPHASVVRTSVERKVRAAFVGTLLMLFVGAGLTYRASVDLAESAQGISRSEQLRDALASLHVALVGAEAAQTAYLVTSRDQERKEYERLAASARNYQRSIAARAAGDAGHLRDVTALDAHVNGRLELLSQVIGLYDENGLSSARELIASDEGAKKMHEIRGAIARMDAEGEQILIERERTFARTRQLTLGLLLLTLAVAAGLFLTLFRGISREMSARAAADAALRVLNREILELNQKLSQRAEAVEAANKELDSFSYSVSHDLRTPLRHIEGYLEMLRTETGPALTAESSRYLDVITDSTRRMNVLIDDLLAFSRMARAEPHVGRVELAALVPEVIAGLEMLTRNRDIEWHIDALPVVSGDRAMLQQALANLLANAVKYTRTRERARIEIGSAGEENGKYVLFVRDNGVGFDMEHAGRLFGIFQRLHRDEEFDGTGIGLANVRSIITRHGGRVWAEAALDRGATFYFSLAPFDG